MNPTRRLVPAPRSHLVRLAPPSALLLAVAAACSSPPPEPVDRTASASSVGGTWLDWEVESFKPLPSVPGLVYVLGTNGNLWREVGTMSTRTWVDSDVLDYQPIDGTVIYVLGTNGNLWREVGSMATRTQVASGVTKFSVTTDGSGLVYYLDGEQGLWVIAGTSPPQQLLASDVAAYQYAPYTKTSNGSWSSALYVLFTGGWLWRADAYYHWNYAAEIDSNIDSFYALDGFNYYAKTTDSNLWRVAGPDRSGSARGLVDSNVASFAPLDTQTIFVAETSGALWREQFTASARDLVATSVQAFQPVGEDSVYVLDRSGSLWRRPLTAPSCSYSYAPRVCNLGAQNHTFVAAWGVETLSGSCPAIQAPSGVWTEIASGEVPGDTSVAGTPTCAGLGLGPSCCLYVWSSATGALQDPSVLCNWNDPQMEAFDQCGVTVPLGGLPPPSPGGGGCIPCMSSLAD